MGTKVNFGGQPVKFGLYFDDLEVNESFKNKSGRGAVYRKVFSGRRSDPTYMMLEEATGRLWNPTASEVERVNVEINIGTAKPALYR